MRGEMLLDAPTFREKEGPEAKKQRDFVALLTLLDWHVMETQGNLYQKGFPDLYAVHPRYGQRWIEMKHYLSFTKHQKEHFPFIHNSVGIWVITDATQEEYAKLFKPANLTDYLRIS